MSDDRALADVTCFLLELPLCRLQGCLVAVHVPAGNLIEYAIRSRSVLTNKNDLSQLGESYRGDDVWNNENVLVDFHAVRHAKDLGGDNHPSARPRPLGDQLPGMDLGRR